MLKQSIISKLNYAWTRYLEGREKKDYDIPLASLVEQLPWAWSVSEATQDKFLFYIRRKVKQDDDAANLECLMD